MVTVFILPLSRWVGVCPGYAVNVSASGGPSLNLGFKDVYVVFDSENNSWIYQIAARNQQSQDVEIIGVVARKQPPGGFINIMSEKQQLAPPFSEGIEVIGGEKTSEKIMVKPGYTVRLRISSKDPLLSISLIEKRGYYDLYFGSFITQKAEEFNEALDPNVKVVLSCRVPPTPKSMKTSFISGEAIYPMAQGLKNGTRFGFRTVDSKGAVIVPLVLDHLVEAKGYGIEGAGRFNLNNEPLFPGSYRTELIIVENETGFITAYLNFSIGPQVYIETLNPNVKVLLTGGSGGGQPSVKTGETIFPGAQGLKNGTTYGFRVVDSKGAVIVPLNLDYLREAYGTEWDAYGSFNSQRNPLLPGAYRAELIIVEEENFLIVAYVNFIVT